MHTFNIQFEQLDNTFFIVWLFCIDFPCMNRHLIDTWTQINSIPKNMKNIKANLKANITVMARCICLKFGMIGAPPRRNIHSKNDSFLFRATDVWKWNFLGSCIIHICLSCTHTGSTRWYTIMCLDYDITVCTFLCFSYWDYYYLPLVGFGWFKLWFVWCMLPVCWGQQEETVLAY